MAAFDSSVIAEGVVSIGNPKLSYRHRRISFRISNCCPFTSRLFVLGSYIVGNLDERCMIIIIMGIYFDELPLAGNAKPMRERCPCFGNLWIF